MKVCMTNAVDKDGNRCEAYIGQDYKFSTTNPDEAMDFDAYDAKRFADHWKGWYRGFAGGASIEIR
jgi:hypothetical protein